MEIMSEEDAGSLSKDSGRKGSRLRSIQRALEEAGKVHPSHIEDGEVTALIVSHRDYLDLLEADDSLPSKKLTDGVKSGLTHRYDIQFNFEEEGSSSKYMVIQPTEEGNFTQYFEEAQSQLDAQREEEED